MFNVMYSPLCAVRLTGCIQESDCLSLAVYIRCHLDDRITPQHLQSLFGDTQGPSVVCVCVHVCLQPKDVYAQPMHCNARMCVHV